MSEYTEQAEKFLKDSGIVFTARLVGSDCPMFCTDKEKGIDLDKLDSFPRKTHIHGKHYLCFLHRADKTLASAISFDFWNSYSDEEFNFVRTHAGDMSFQTLDRVLGRKGYNDGALGVLPLKHKARTVQAYDLIACLTKSDPGTFHNFCGEFGYDEDSRKAYQVYEAVQKEWAKIQRFFSAEEIEKLQEIQ